MFNIGMPELLLILVVALIVLGPKKLPELARSIGKGLAELKKSTSGLKESFNLDEDLKDVQQDLKNIVDPSHYLETVESSPLSPDNKEKKAEDNPIAEIPAQPTPKAPNA